MKNLKKVLAVVMAIALIVTCFAACGGNNNGDTDAKKVKAALICLHGDSSTYDKNFIDAFKQACAN